MTLLLLKTGDSGEAEKPAGEDAELSDLAHHLADGRAPNRPRDSQLDSLMRPAR